MYYRGLALRIKDSLAISGKPDTLDELRTKAQALDLCHWEHREEDRYKSNTPSNPPSRLPPPLPNHPIVPLPTPPVLTITIPCPLLRL